MAWQHHKWEERGRTLYDDVTGFYLYKSRCGQHNVDLGEGNYASYVWDSENEIIEYANCIIEFYDWYQIFKDRETEDVLIDDQRFELQYWRATPGDWRVIDLWQRELTVNEGEEYCTVTKRLFDGEGNELKIDFQFKLHRNLKLTFTLTVADADLYRIRWQNTGIAGDLTEKHHWTQEDPPIDLGVIKLLFEKINFFWNVDEINIHEGYEVEQQASGKKLDFFLGEFDLEDNETIIISPTTWGPNETSDDCNSYDGTYEDEYNGEVSVGDSLMHTGWIWSSVTVPNGATLENGCKITVTTGGVTYSEDQDLKIVDSNTPAAWSQSNLPEDAAVHPIVVAWDNYVDESPTDDSPELKTFIQQRISDDHQSGDSIAIVLIEDVTSGESSCESEESGDGAFLTIVYGVVAADYHSRGIGRGIGRGIIK